jgi:hypothetical protein
MELLAIVCSAAGHKKISKTLPTLLGACFMPLCEMRTQGNCHPDCFAHFELSLYACLRIILHQAPSSQQKTKKVRQIRI